MAKYNSAILVAMLVLAFSSALLAQESMDTTNRDVHKLRPQFPTSVLVEKSEMAIQDGLNYLIESQNEDGSWGSHDPKLPDWANLAFSVRKRGSHDAV